MTLPKFPVKEGYKFVEMRHHGTQMGIELRGASTQMCRYVRDIACENRRDHSNCKFASECRVFLQGYQVYNLKEEEEHNWVFLEFWVQQEEPIQAFWDNLEKLMAEATPEILSLYEFDWG
jgi:hypothetical protein